MFSTTALSQLWSVSWVIRLSWEIISNRRLVSRAWRVNQLLQLRDQRQPAAAVRAAGHFIINDRCCSSGSLCTKSTGCWCSCLDNHFLRTHKQMQLLVDARGSLGEVTPSAAGRGLYDLMQVGLSHCTNWPQWPGSQPPMTRHSI